MNSFPLRQPIRRSWRGWTLGVATLVLLGGLVPLTRNYLSGDDAPVRAAVERHWSGSPAEQSGWRARLAEVDGAPVDRPALRAELTSPTPVLEQVPGRLWAWRLGIRGGGPAARLHWLAKELPPGRDYRWTAESDDARWRLSAAQAARDEPAAMRLAFAGDVMFSDALAPRVAKLGFHWPWQEVAAHRSRWDALVVNLETAVSAGTQPTRLKLPSELAANQEFIFNAPPKAVRAMAAAGVAGVTLGNNHSTDHGVEGLNQTLALLDRHDLVHSGAGRDLAEATAPAILERNGVRVAIVSFCDATLLPRPQTFAATAEQAGVAMLFTDLRGVVKPASARLLKETVADAEKKADVVIAVMHWGLEGTLQLSNAQRQLAHRAIDAGADAVIGHHPHVVQPVEWYRGAPVFYSLGNFIFSGYDAPDLWRAIVVRLTIDRTGVIWSDVAPVEIVRNRPQFTPRGEIRDWIGHRLLAGAGS